MGFLNVVFEGTKLRGTYFAYPGMRSQCRKSRQSNGRWGFPNYLGRDGYREYP